jgi:hypothetical protein
MARVEEDREGSVVYAVMFDCPGCQLTHLLHVRGAMVGFSGPSWEYNGNADRPTLQPSILASWTAQHNAPRVCHSFVTDGRIQFLDDCTHHLKGQTVDLPEIEEILHPID